MSAEAIQVKYSCNLCGIYRATVTIRARTPGEDVVYWVEKVCIVAVANDHSRRSPYCTSEKLDELMIPIEGAEMVGGPTQVEKPEKPQ